MTEETLLRSGSVIKIGARAAKGAGANVQPAGASARPCVIGVL